MPISKFHEASPLLTPFRRASILAVLVLLAIFPSTLHAQQWTVGDQGVNWNVLSTFPTGSAPADAYEPAEAPLPAGVVESDWNIQGTDQYSNARGTNFYVNPSDATAEKKIRITCDAAGPPKQKDNILGFGIAKFGHPHQGFGASEWDENTTYLTLRANPKSNCTGGPMNASNYMEPALETKLANGATVSVIPQNQANYYVEGAQSEPNISTWLRRDMKFIIGANPKNFNDTARRNVYAAAGFLYPGSPDTPAGFNGWYCIPSGSSSAITVTDTTARMKNQYGAVISTKARYLKGPNGEDPWGGGCTGTVSAPASMVNDLIAPGCWDRHNLESPDGRGHFWYEGTKGDSSVVGACPTTTAGDSYGRVPRLEVKNIYETTGFADYGEWHYGSDRIDPAQSVTQGCSNDPVTLGDSCSLNPCRQVGPYFCNGSTAHADYTFGWFGPVFEQMQRECLGIPVRGIAPVDGPAECNSSQVDRNHNLRYGPISAPLTDWTDNCTNLTSCSDASPAKPLERYRLIPGMDAGNVTIHHGG